MKLVVAVLLLLSCSVCGVKADIVLRTTTAGTHRTPCQQARADTPSVAGAYRPQCDRHGQYTPQQCWPSTGYTWCVNDKGEELPGTLLQGYNQRKCQATSLTPCQWAHSNCSPIPGRYCPQCDRNGQYTPLQTSGSTGYSWCVTTSGQKIPGTLKRYPPPNCTKTELTPCEKANDICPKGLGGCIPTCDNEGQYTPQQCCAATNSCWCVNPNGKRTPNPPPCQ